MTNQDEHSIEEIIENKWLVKFDRKPLDNQPLFGFIVGFNENFTLVHKFGEELFMLDGYCVFPNADVRNYAVYDDPEYFFSEVVKAKEIVPNPLPEISMTSWPEIVQSVAKEFPVFVVETERLHKGECYLGRLKKMRKTGFETEDLDTEAYWDGTSRYKFRDLTVIGFGGYYETALELVNKQRDSA